MSNSALSRTIAKKSLEIQMSTTSKNYHSKQVNKIQNKIDGKIKPRGSLGKLERLAAQIAQVQLNDNPNKLLSIDCPTICIFAGDHGIAKHQVSIAPSDVTSLMVNCFLHDQAAINCFVKDTRWELKVIDCGILQDLPAHNKLISARLGRCCGDISIESALTNEQLSQAKTNANHLIHSLRSNLIAFGEMGIGNTTSASAIFAKLFSLDEEVVGLGTGINNEQLAKKIELVKRATKRVKTNEAEAILAELGSFEIATMTYSMLSAYQENKLILIDGFIVTAAAALALAIIPEIKSNMIFAHTSKESAHADILNRLGVSPLLDLSLCLGEGTGAALCLPLIDAAVNFYNHMASFEDLGIDL